MRFTTEGLLSLKYSFQCFIASYKCPQSHLPILFGNRCVWCQTTVHDDCLSSLSDDLCDLGEFRSVIIPPYYLYQVNKLRRRHPEEYSKVRINSQQQTSFKQGLFFSILNFQLCTEAGLPVNLLFSVYLKGHHILSFSNSGFCASLTPVKIRGSEVG